MHVAVAGFHNLTILSREPDASLVESPLKATANTAMRWRGKDVIWVPPEYRPSAIYLPYQSVRCVGSTMVLATGSGRIIFLKIKEQEIFVDGLW